MCVQEKDGERRREICVRVNIEDMYMQPPKNGDIALWPNTRVVKCKYYVSQKRNESNIKVQRYTIYSIVYLRSWLGFISLKHIYMYKYKYVQQHTATHLDVGWLRLVGSLKL